MRKVTEISMQQKLRIAKGMRDLFGGAIVVNVDERFVDLSRFRQVPDNQEVFTDAQFDQSISFELNQLAEEANAENIGKFYWQDLVDMNEASGNQINMISKVSLSDFSSFKSIPINSCCRIVRGIQNVSKFNEGPTATNQIRVILLIIRLENVSTDFVVTISTPELISESSSSSGFGTTIAAADSDQLVLDNILQTLDIRNWQLFG